jgi:CubicO group peptidase (beta-lactamase class C family)
MSLRPLARLSALAFVLLLVAGREARAKDPLPRSAPEAQGVSSPQVQAFVEAIDRDVLSMHSFMLVRHGQVVAEGWWSPEAAEKQHVMWSLSKSFCSTAVGLAVAEGKVNLDDPVLKYFPDDAPAEPSENLRAMRVRDLLTMSTGHETVPAMTNDEPWVRTFLKHPVPHPPGTRFLYNTPATHMASVIVTKTTGQTVLEYLGPRLWEPLGIENPQWGTSPQGNTLGGYGLSVRTEDVAKFGQLYLRRGRWGERSLLGEAWIDEATRKQVDNSPGRANPAESDWAQGYGFQFWRCRHGAYRGDGKDGQFCVVLPEQDAVVVMTADTGDMQKQLNVVWKHLLPAFRAETLPPDPAAEAALKAALARLELRPRTPAAGAAR